MIIWPRLMLLFVFMGAWLPHGQAAQAATDISATTPLGTTTSATLTLDNTGQPATTVQLYESWPAVAARPQPEQTVRVALPKFTQPLDPQLQREFASAADGRSTMIVYLRDQADLSAAAAITDWGARGIAVYHTLRQHAQRSQADVLADLTRRGVAVQSLWIVNALVVRGDAALAQSLAKRADVATISANTQHHLEATEASPFSADSLARDSTVAWGLTKIGAPQVWADWGVRGQGIVVANIDTGVYMTHTALLEGYRGWSPTGISHDYNWYDPTDVPFAAPTDTAGHGTHTMGTIAGRTNGITTTIGVAPAVRWIAARGCQSLFCNDADLIRSAQWMLAPTRANCQPTTDDDCSPRPDLRPHIINNSWGNSATSDWYLGYVAAWNAAGILSVFANGNNGRSGCRTSLTPASYAAAWSVGATDDDDLIAAFSSRGPTLDNRTKPDLSAPGVDVVSAWPNGGLMRLQGTSMAAPHVAGAAALLWSVNPTLIGDLPATYAALSNSSVPRYSTECGDAATARPNNVYGWGRLDAYAAVRTARVDVPWLSVPTSVALPANGSSTVAVTLDGRQVVGPGVYRARILVGRNSSLSEIAVQLTVTAAPNTALLVGKIVDRWTSNGVYGRIQFAGGPQVTTDYSGAYTVTLPYGAYPITATASGYLSEGTLITIPAQSTTVLTLTPNIPHLLVNAPTMSATLPFGGAASFPITLANAGPQPAHVTAQVPPIEWSVQDSASGGPNAPLYDLNSFPALRLQDDQVYTDALDLGFAVPIYGSLANQIYVSSNGWISAVYQRGGIPSAKCLPANSLPAASLAPFWTDLDPSKGGAIRAGKVDSDTFVVSYEAVPLWQEASITATIAPTYTFQVALHADGRVQFHYGTMGGLPANWSIGTSHSPLRGQSLACSRNPQALSGRTWTLRNQASASQWIAVFAPVTVPPQSTITITGTLRGFGYTPWRDAPAEGTLRLHSDDPRRPIIDISATITVGAPPYQVQLPLINR